MSILFLHDREWLETLGKHREALGMYADFTCLSAENESLHTDEVAQVEQFLEDSVVEVLVFIGADVVASDIYLDASF